MRIAGEMMIDHGIIEHADKHGWLYAVLVAVLSFVSTWLTRKGRAKRTEKDQTAERSKEVWEQARELRQEHKERVEELEERVGSLTRQLLEAEHSLANSRLREVRGDSQWDSLVRQLWAEHGDRYKYLKLKGNGHTQSPSQATQGAQTTEVQQTGGPLAL